MFAQASKWYKKIPKQIELIDIIACLLVIIFTIVGIIVSIVRFNQYEAYYIDFGQYDQIIWEVAHFQEPLVDHFVLGFINVFADHFTPSIFLLSPLYWITDNKFTILIAQAVVVGLSGFVLYLIGKILLKNKLLSISVLVCYFLFVGLQNAVITEFHELTIMTFPFMLTFWAFVKNKRILYLIFLIITLGFKESTFLVGIGIGIAVFLLSKNWRWIAFVTVLISLLWGLIAFKVIIPHFSSTGYVYAQNIPDGVFEKIAALVDHPLKQHTIFFSLLSFGFLPLLSPQFWFLILQDYAGRFMPENFVTRWDLGLHYNAESAVILSLALIFGLHFLQNRKIFKNYLSLIAVLLILNAVILNRFILNGPFNLVYNTAFYKHSENFVFLDKMIKQIPERATVATHNNLATRFTHQRVWLLKEDYDFNKPDYILIDNRENQNPNNYLGSRNINSIILNLLEDKKYQILYKTKEQYIFKRR